MQAYPAARYTGGEVSRMRADTPAYYEIKIRGHLDPKWSDWFDGLTLAHLEGNVTLLSGQLPDQAALYGLLERIRDLNLILISVNCGDPSTQDTDLPRSIAIRGPGG